MRRKSLQEPKHDMAPAAARSDCRQAFRLQFVEMFSENPGSESLQVVAGLNTTEENSKYASFPKVRVNRVGVLGGAFECSGPGRTNNAIGGFHYAGIFIAELWKRLSWPALFTLNKRRLHC